MGWFTPKRFKEKDRIKALEAATIISMIQIEIGAHGKAMYEKMHTYYALGYLFGLYQASLETIPSTELTQEDYTSHISQGFEKAYLTAKYGREMFDTASKHSGHPQFRTGVVDGAKDYVGTLNDKGYKPTLLAEFLLHSDPP